MKKELQDKLNITNAQLESYIKTGLPYYSLGEQYRFLESEIMKWLESYEQERLESGFLDEKGRTLGEYVTEAIAHSTLRISTVHLNSLKNKGMPYVTVGKKDFFHIQDILDHFRVGDTLQKHEIEEPLKALLGLLTMNVPKETPVLIVDGSYTRPKAGTGIVLVENWEKVTGKSNVHNVKNEKSVTCEYIAVIDALRLIKKRKFTSAVILTDQKHWTKNFSVSIEKAEKPVKGIIQQGNQLWEEMKETVKIRFVEDLTNGKKNPLYKTAHELSRNYKKETIQNLQSR
ncbi:hypothetical protein [Bacillus sp. FJAT-27225]|uniref:hypothetical protein n=1 Tax=Bacillus sp. FJAT-27225 TaxID=1743144 RepID=UPI00111230BB|nr:hypothetical protein [Bacillus sp. FJAT-27225]